MWTHFDLFTLRASELQSDLFPEPIILRFLFTQSPKCDLHLTPVLKHDVTSMSNDSGSDGLSHLREFSPPALSELVGSILEVFAKVSSVSHGKQSQEGLEKPGNGALERAEAAKCAALGHF